MLFFAFITAILLPFLWHVILPVAAFLAVVTAPICEWRSHVMCGRLLSPVLGSLPFSVVQNSSLSWSQLLNILRSLS